MSRPTEQTKKQILRILVESIDLLSERNFNVVSSRLGIDEFELQLFVDSCRDYLVKEDALAIQIETTDEEEIRRFLMQRTDDAIKELDDELAKTIAAHQAELSFEREQHQEHLAKVITDYNGKLLDANKNAKEQISKADKVLKTIKATRSPLVPMMPILLLFDALSFLFPRPIIKTKA